MKTLYVAGAIALYSCLGWATAGDLATFTTKDFFLKSLPTGCQPKGARVSPDGHFLYLAEMCGKIDAKTGKRVPTASIYDMDKLALAKTLVTPVGIRNGILANTEVDFSMDGQWALIARAEGNSQSGVYQDMGLVTVVNTKTQQIVKYVPVHGQGAKIIATRPMVQGSPQQIVYVANYFSDDISVLDINDMKEDGNLKGDSYYLKKIFLNTHFKAPVNHGYKIAPRGVAFTPDGKYALVLDTEAGSLFVIDSINHKQLAEIAPISKEFAGRDLNLRHIVISKDGNLAYLSHMRGNAVSRINMKNLIQMIEALPQKGPDVVLPTTVWQQILVPFQMAHGPQNFLILEDYPADHPNLPNKKWPLAHPNTIVLDPIQNRYLYVSSRTTTVEGDTSVNPNLMGKIDVIDTNNGATIISLVGGAQPTALDITPDGKTLISSGLISAKLYFYDVSKIKRIYEQGRPR